MLPLIRADENLKTIPVLLVRAEAKQENIVEAAQAGVSNYIVRPVNAATLLEKLNKISPKLRQKPRSTKSEIRNKLEQNKSKNPKP